MAAPIRPSPHHPSQLIDGLAIFATVGYTGQCKSIQSRNTLNSAMAGVS